MYFDEKEIWDVGVEPCGQKLQVTMDEGRMQMAKPFSGTGIF